MKSQDVIVNGVQIYFTGDAIEGLFLHLIDVASGHGGGIQLDALGAMPITQGLLERVRDGLLDTVADNSEPELR